MFKQEEQLAKVRGSTKVVGQTVGVWGQFLFLDSPMDCLKKKDLMNRQIDLQFVGPPGRNSWFIKAGDPQTKTKCHVGALSPSLIISYTFLGTWKEQ